MKNTEQKTTTNKHQQSVKSHLPDLWNLRANNAWLLFQINSEILLFLDLQSPSKYNYSSKEWSVVVYPISWGCSLQKAVSTINGQFSQSSIQNKSGWARRTLAHLMMCGNAAECSTLATAECSTLVTAVTFLYSSLDPWRCFHRDLGWQ